MVSLVFQENVWTKTGQNVLFKCDRIYCFHCDNSSSLPPCIPLFLSRTVNLGSRGCGQSDPRCFLLAIWSLAPVSPLPMLPPSFPLPINLSEWRFIVREFVIICCLMTDTFPIHFWSWSSRFDRQGNSQTKMALAVSYTILVGIAWCYCALLCWGISSWTSTMFWGLIMDLYGSNQAEVVPAQTWSVDEYMCVHVILSLTSSQLWMLDSYWAR